MQVDEAKDFLVKQAVEQARIEGASLSDLEKRMMYFTEGPDSVEDPLSLNEEFEEQCDTTKYEAKLRKLLANAYKRLKTESPALISEWGEAIETLEEGDHYLLVLLGSGFLERNPDQELISPSFWKVLAVGIFVLIVLLIVFGASLHYGDSKPPLPNTMDSIPSWYSTYS